MLVTLGTNTAISANASQTFTYSPESVQKVFVRLEDPDWELCTITVQVGSTTICNGASTWGLWGLASLTSNIIGNVTGSDTLISLDFGSHVLTQNDNLYVTVSAGASAMDAVDVSALVDEPGANFPVRITEYSDNTFTSPNNLFGICYDNGRGAIEEDGNNCTIRTNVSSSAPTFISSASWYQAEMKSQDYPQQYGILNRHAVPLSTTYNYVENVVDRILTVEQMGTTLREQRQAKQSANIALSQAGK